MNEVINYGYMSLIIKAKRFNIVIIIIIVSFFNLMASKSILFHLVPTNQDSFEALSHPDNKRFVSPSPEQGKLGLEIGYHVPSIPGGHVITRLGRNSDLILRETNSEKRVSAVHVSFELHPSTQLVVLSVRSKYIASVKFKIMEPKPGSEKQEDNTEPGPEDGSEQEEEITGDGVILYGQDYKLTIASYEFDLVWRKLWQELSGYKKKKPPIFSRLLPFKATRNPCNGGAMQGRATACRGTTTRRFVRGISQGCAQRTKLRSRNLGGFVSS